MKTYLQYFNPECAKELIEYIPSLPLLPNKDDVLHILGREFKVQFRTIALNSITIHCCLLN